MRSGTTAAWDGHCCFLFENVLLLGIIQIFEYLTLEGRQGLQGTSGDCSAFYGLIAIHFNHLLEGETVEGGHLLENKRVLFSILIERSIGCVR